MIYFAYIHNNTDSRDDDVIKMDMKSFEGAEAYANSYVMGRGNCTLGKVYTRKEFKKSHPDWHSLMWGVKPSNS
jgi:hypothetical protein